MKHLKVFESNNDGLQFSLEDFADVIQLEWENYKGLEKLYQIVDITIERTELPKGILGKKVIIKRLSDGRLFEFRYSCDDDGSYPITSHGFANPRTMIGKEVFPHKVTMIVYKYKPQ